ncbi:hypothetical protein OU798_07420 [Prolixibacteraceae bacterium Z1-6]|uniref:Uncharacterized protein n=1 Tax=Draconibacterium aestuarii TaxID=2998507 RepID=A0A9X3J660_9BACT|nr:hypothetical protein [Prolixibacteraceae bacterium Z1-6]
MEEEKKDSTEQSSAPTPTLTDDLISAFIEQYSPARLGMPGVELKSSTDVIEEMESICTVNKELVAAALKEAGFTFSYTDAGPFWVLLPKVNL